MNYGVSTASFYPTQTEDALKIIGENRIKHCEIFFNTTSEIKTPYINNLKVISEYYGITVDSSHPFTCAFDPFMMFSDYRQRLSDFLDFHKMYFEAMNVLDSKIFVFHGDRKESTLCDEEYFERFAMLKELGTSYKITVAQENVSRCKSRSVEFLSKMRDYFGGDLGLVFDNKQAVRSGVDYKEFIKILGNNIIHVHISDNSEQDDCMAIGKGTLDISDLKDCLIKAGFAGSMVVELYRERLQSDDEVLESYKNLILR